MKTKMNLRRAIGKGIPAALLVMCCLLFSNAYSQVASPPYNQSNLKSIKLNSTQQGEITKLFGDPDVIQVTPQNETWTYEGGDSRLTVMFENRSKTVVEYNLFMQFHSTTRTIQPADVALLTKESPDRVTIKETYGEPSSVIINPTSETWSYEAPGSKLVLTIGARTNRLDTFTLTYDTHKN